MSKRIGNLWEPICEFENLYNGYLNTRKRRRYHKSILRYTANLEENLYDLHDQFVNLTWHPSMSVVKTVFWPKCRIITAPVVADRVAFHSIVDVIEPYFEKKFLFHSYACRCKKGTHKAVKAVQHHVYGLQRWEGGGYVLKADIQNYFGTIDHQRLKKIIRKTLKDKRLLSVLDSVIDEVVISPEILKRILSKALKDREAVRCFDVIIDAGNLNERMLQRMIRKYITRKPMLNFLDRIIFAACHPEVGLPLGALTSQLFANVYLDQLDHYVKEVLQVKHYFRYMDDFIILSTSKDYLRDVLGKIDVYLQEALALKLNPKTSIFPLQKFIDFCGYRIRADRLTPRKRNVVTARHRLKKLNKEVLDGSIPFSKFQASLMSFLGYVKHCKASTTVQHMLEELKL